MLSARNEAVKSYVCHARQEEMSTEFYSQATNTTFKALTRELVHVPNARFWLNLRLSLARPIYE